MHLDVIPSRRVSDHVGNDDGVSIRMGIATLKQAVREVGPSSRTTLRTVEIIV
jgi:hypothetical protein